MNGSGAKARNATSPSTNGNENGAPGADSTDPSIRLTVACQYR